MLTVRYHIPLCRSDLPGGLPVPVAGGAGDDGGEAEEECSGLEWRHSHPGERSCCSGGNIQEIQKLRIVLA